MRDPEFDTLGVFIDGLSKKFSDEDTEAISKLMGIVPIRPSCAMIYEMFEWLLRKAKDNE